MKGKRLGFIMTLVLIMALAMPAWAADTKIDSVKLDLSYSGEEPKSGNEIGRLPRRRLRLNTPRIQR